jgi:hypothetical protein
MYPDDCIKVHISTGICLFTKNKITISCDVARRISTLRVQGCAEFQINCHQEEFKPPRCHDDRRWLIRYRTLYLVRYRPHDEKKVLRVFLRRIILILSFIINNLATSHYSRNDGWRQSSRRVQMRKKQMERKVSLP